MDITIHGILTQAQQRWANRGFVYTRQGEAFTGHTFGQLAGDAQALAAALAHGGHQKKNILLLGQNSYEWMVADLAISGYVGVCVAANCDWKPHVLQQAIQQTDISCIVYAEQQKSLLEQIKGVEGVPAYSLQKDLPALLRQGRALLGQNGDLPTPQTNTAALCKIFFSSGTTGGPKAVMLCQHNLFWGVPNLARRVQMVPEDRCYLLLPLYHTYGGIYNFLYMLHAGAQVYLASAGVQNMLQEMQMVRPTVFCGVPKLFGGLNEAAAQAKNPKEALVQMFGGQLRALFCGGSPSQSGVRHFYKQAGLNWLEAYALTETASSFSIEYPATANDTSVGTLFEDIAVRIEGDGPGKPGQVLVKGGNVFLGYYGDEAATAAAFDADGFFRTGDIGWLDDENRLYLTGRKNRIFSTATGHQVDPAEIERLLLAKGKLQAARIYCKEGGVALRAASLLPLKEVEALVAEINKELPPYMRVKSIELTLPEDGGSWKE